MVKFMIPYSSKKTEKSRKKSDGEIVLIANNQQDILEKSVLITYDVVKKKKNFVSSKGLAKRLDQLREMYTKEKSPETKLFFYPFV